MPAKGYTTAAKVANALGRTFSGGQSTQADLMIEAAESIIDRITGRSWMVASPITDELHVLDGPVGNRSDLLVARIAGGEGAPAAPVYLDHAPVTAVTAVKARTQGIGSAQTTLTAGTQYELLDAAQGIMMVAQPPGYIVKVSYTHSGPAVPADISHACAVLAGHLMTTYLNPQSATYRRISVGSGDVSVEFRDLDSNALPGVVREILAGYRLPMVFA